MRLKMSEKSVFAYLLRSPWWVSMLCVLVYALVARLIVPEKYLIYALACAGPFLIAAVITGWRQWQVPSDTQVASTIEKVSGMSSAQFRALMEKTFQREGYLVTSAKGVADFKLVKNGRTTLLSCKRWKAATHGVEALIELESARLAESANESIYVATGTISDNARKYAMAHRIRLVMDAELSKLLRLPK